MAKVIYLYNLPEEMRPYIKSSVGELSESNIADGYCNVYFELVKPWVPMTYEVFDLLRDMDIHVGVYSLVMRRKIESFKVVE